MTLRMHQPAPALDLPLAGGGRFKLGDNPPKGWDNRKGGALLVLSAVFIVASVIFRS